MTLLTYEESSNETCCQKELLPHLQITFYWASKQGEIWFLARHIQIIEIVYLKEEIKSVSSLKKKTVCNNYNLNHRMTYILKYFTIILFHIKKYNHIYIKSYSFDLMVCWLLPHFTLVYKIILLSFLLTSRLWYQNTQHFNLSLY